MKRTVWGTVLALLVFSALPGHAQQSRNAVYFELGGSAVIPSFNYEHRLNENWYGRAGLSWVRSASTATNATTYIVPLTASWVNRPASNHHLELGGGVTIATGDRQDLYGDVESGGTKFSKLLATGIVGYRYQKPQGGFQFRAVFTPVVGSGVHGPWAGVSFGYAW